ncbi:MAG TPA: bifunctional precorrin-2 dehydrogenase/sirohydrochlorin ferrochelatase, partial [Syntrophorhabdaceae bacterium]|nr:bifunctional precorrin-2 dehydrogenase/sirohydrochlorin ferrochelatase [Syntrophorhabdaceae bacterium]
MKNTKTNFQISKSLDKHYYPIFLDLKNRLCLVIGGGQVAERKVNILIKCGARVRVIAPSMTKRLLNLGEKGKIEILKRDYKKGDIKGAFIVFAATDNKNINQEIKKDAQALGVITNVVDDPEYCDFIVPSIVKKGPVIIAISTSGTLPMFARVFKEKVEQILTDEHIRYVKKIGRLRKIIQNEVADPKKRNMIMDEIKNSYMNEIMGM